VEPSKISLGKLYVILQKQNYISRNHLHQIMFAQNGLPRTLRNHNIVGKGSLWRIMLFGKDYSAQSFCWRWSLSVYITISALRNHTYCERESLNWILLTKYLLVNYNSTAAKAEIRYMHSQTVRRALFRGVSSCNRRHLFELPRRKKALGIYEGKSNWKVLQKY
jgi:hypothetical protein